MDLVANVMYYKREVGRRIDVSDKKRLIPDLAWGTGSVL